MPAIQVTLLNQTFDQRMVFYGSRRTAEVVTYGGGHTGSDAFLYLPAEQVAFMGDLIFMEYHPWLPDGDPAEWVRILDEVERLALSILVPGHGPVASARDLELTRRYVIALTHLAEEAVRRGQSVEQAVQAPISAPFETWGWPHFFTTNIRFLYERATLRTGGESAGDEA